MKTFITSCVVAVILALFVSISGDPDDGFYDSTRHRIYAVSDCPARGSSFMLVAI